MTRLFGAFLSVIAATVAAFRYFQVFADEFDPRDPANRGAGVLAPMYRHWIEYVVICWTTMLSTAIGYYLTLGSGAGIKVNWAATRSFFFRLHAISGAVILFGLLVAVITGRPIQTRDAVTAGIGIRLLILSAAEGGIWANAPKSG